MLNSQCPFSLCRSALAHLPLTCRASKLAKGILSRDRQNLMLWDGYARLERSRGKLADSRNVYAKALSMYRSFAEPDRIDAPQLWRAWAEMEWEEGRTNHVLRIVVAAALSEVERFDLGELVQSPARLS